MITPKTSCNVFIIIFFYVFYYRIACCWIRLYIRSFCFLHGVVFLVSFQNASAPTSIFAIHFLPAEWFSCIFSTVKHFRGHVTIFGHKTWCALVQAYIWTAKVDYFVKILFLFSSSDAVQILQAEVTKLKERLEDSLRNKKPISSIRSAPSTQDNSSNQSSSSSCFRLFLFFSFQCST